MRKVLVIGANGQLGTDLVRQLQRRPLDWQTVPLTHRDIDICAHGGTRHLLTSLRPDVVINTAAYHRVDELEDHVEKAFQVNAIAVRNIALICKSIDAALVHLSTDHVFGGNRQRAEPYTELDTPAPLNVYGASKLAGEYFLRAHCPKHFLLRSSGLFGTGRNRGQDANFVELMLRLAREDKPIRVVNDQRMTPTSTVSLAHQILLLMDTDKYGLYHATSQGDCTWFEFASEIFEQSHLTPNLISARTADFREKVARPSYSVLDNKALRTIGLDTMPPWKEALGAYLAERSARSIENREQRSSA